MKTSSMWLLCYISYLERCVIEAGNMSGDCIFCFKRAAFQKWVLEYWCWRRQLVDFLKLIMQSTDLFFFSILDVNMTLKREFTVQYKKHLLKLRKHTLKLLRVPAQLVLSIPCVDALLNKHANISSVMFNLPNCVRRQSFPPPFNWWRKVWCPNWARQRVLLSDTHLQPFTLNIWTDAFPFLYYSMTWLSRNRRLGLDRTTGLSYQQLR